LINPCVRFPGKRRKGSGEAAYNVRGKTLLTMEIWGGKRGIFIFLTDNSTSCNGMNSSGFHRIRIDRGNQFENRRFYINGFEGFWSFQRTIDEISRDVILRIFLLSLKN